MTGWPPSSPAFGPAFTPPSGDQMHDVADATAVQIAEAPIDNLIAGTLEAYHLSRAYRDPRIRGYWVAVTARLVAEVKRRAVRA